MAANLGLRPLRASRKVLPCTATTLPINAVILQRHGSGQGQTTHSSAEQQQLKQHLNSIVQSVALPQRGESERTTSPTFPSTTRPPAQGKGRIQRRLERLEWLCFDDKCNRLDALSCSSTLVSFYTRVQVSCADISPSFSHLMLDNSAGDIKGRRVFST